MRKLSARISSLVTKEPFAISGYVFTKVDALVIEISQDGVSGTGEAAGVYYLQENAESMLAQVDSVKGRIAEGASRTELLGLLPAGGARNAIDCALWDLECKLSGKSIWELTGIKMQPQNTVMTVGIGPTEAMAAKAASLDSSHIKVKLDAERPLERMQAICNARPDAKIVVDVNQGWEFEQLTEMAPEFARLGIKMIEQPLKRGGDAVLEGYEPPISLCADESCLDSSEFEAASRRYQMINIKLDKTGGLTEALNLAQLARNKGLSLMVGNMLGTSRAMAPGFVVAQLCDFVDLDGALFLTEDCDHPMKYDGGLVRGLSSKLWG